MRAVDWRAWRCASSRRKIRVVAIDRAGSDGQMEHPPRRDTRFAAGDRAYLVGPYEELLSVLGRERLGSS